MSNVLDNLGRIKVTLGSNNTGAWPAPGELMIGTTAYSDIATAFAAASSGNTIKGAGTFTCDGETLPAGVNLVGAGPGTFTLQSSTAATTLNLGGSNFVAGLTVNNTTNSGSATSGLHINTDGSTVFNCAISATNAGAGVGSAVLANSAANHSNWLKSCVLSGDIGITAASASQPVVYLQQSYVVGTAFAIEITTNAIIECDFTLINGSLSIPASNNNLRGTFADTDNSLRILGSSSFVEIHEIGAPGTSPATDNWYVYFQSDGIHIKDDAGNDYNLRQAASESLPGIAEIATQAETDAGTDDARIVTPLKLANAATVNKSGYKNLLYSSMCHDLWQEGTTLNDLADDTYGPDTVWNVLNKSNAPDISGQAGGASDPFTRSFRCTFDAANEQAGIVQFLEAEDTYPLRGQIVSLSADLWGTNVGTLRMAVIEWTSTADALTSDVVGTWGTGNPTLATNWAYIGTPAAITISGTRTRYEVENLTVGASTNNLGVFIWTDANEGSGDLWNVARVQLEIGPVATAFQARPFGVEYELVSRFWLKSYALATAPGTATNVNREAYQTRRALAGTTAGTPLIETVMFPYRMRVAPTVVLYSTSTGTANAIFNNNAAADRTGCTAGSVGDNRFGQVDADNTSATAIALDQALSFHYTASARL